MKKLIVFTLIFCSITSILAMHTPSYQPGAVPTAAQIEHMSFAQLQNLPQDIINKLSMEAILEYTLRLSEFEAIAQQTPHIAPRPSTFTGPSIPGQRATTIRILPVAYDHGAKNWSVLFGVNPHAQPREIWTSFDDTVASNEHPQAKALQTLAIQTNNNIVPLSPLDQALFTEGNDMYFLVPVSFIPGNMLYNNARNQYRTNFAWIPAQEIIQRDPTNLPITRPHEGKSVRIPYLLHTILQNNLLTTLGQLHTPLQQVQPVPAPTIQPAPIQPMPSTSQPQPAQPIPSPSQPQPNIQLITQTRNALQNTHWLNIPTPPGAIHFYDKNKPYYAFTNFYPAPMNFKGQTWPTSEHAYQAQKFTQRPDIQTLIKNTPTPSAVFAIAQKNSASVDKNWQQRSLQTMVDVVREKFRNPALEKQLLGTGTAVLVEASPVDGFYGYSTAPDKSGKPQLGLNHLGRILMYIRAEKRGAIKPNTPYDHNNPYPGYYAQ